MKKGDIVTSAILGLGLLGIAAVGAIAYRFDAWRFRNRVSTFARQFPERIEKLRVDLVAEEMIVEEEGPPNG